LRQRGLAHALHGQQAFLPLALKKQALLRAVAQVALVVLPAPGHALAQAQFFQQVLHLARVVAGHGQVVRAQRAGNAVDRPPRLLPPAVSSSSSRAKSSTPASRSARRRQPGHSNHHLRAAHHGGRGQGALGQRAARHTGKAARGPGESTAAARAWRQFCRVYAPPATPGAAQASGPRARAAPPRALSVAGGRREVCFPHS
jgi:hypothetical protein